MTPERDIPSAVGRADRPTEQKPAQLLDWARRLQAIAQTGVAYGEPDAYDRERYEQIRQIAAEMFASDGNIETTDAILRLEIGHATPKLDVRGAVFRNGEILLVREEGAWGLPGGWADVGESPGEAVVREVLEESGYKTHAVKLLCLQDRDRQGYTPHAWHVWKAIFLCELVVDVQAALNSETDAGRFFAREALPEHLRYGHTTRALIERVFEHREHPDWPTDFD
jgi:ADP-ribose pyrophosphatase YjhB (NUDIX family)